MGEGEDSRERGLTKKEMGEDGEVREREREGGGEHR